MRKILLATTALAGTALFALPASAGMEVTVGGYDDFRAGFFEQRLPVATTKRNEDFENEFQLEIEAKEKTSNGIEYGAVASLWNGASIFANPGGQTIDVHQAYTFVNGSWGQIRAGDEHGASDMYVEAPMTYDFGAQTDGNYTEFVNQNTVFTITPLFLDDDENSTKVTYITPKLGMSGHSVQAAVSYLPNLSDQGQSTILTNPAGGGSPATGGIGTVNAVSRYQNLVEAGGKYEGNWMDKLNVVAGFALHTADPTNNTTWSGSGVRARAFTAWDAGAQASYAGFTVGGSYADAGRYNTDFAGVQNKGQTVWNVGATYKFDRASVGGSYLNGEGYNNRGFGGAVATNNSNRVDEYEAWGIGAGYSLFDGMVTSVDAVFFDQNRLGLAGDDRDGRVVIISNRVAF